MSIQLNPKDVQAAAEAANEFIDQHGDMEMSYETILALCFTELRLSAKATRTPVAAEPSDEVPDWFAEGAKRFAGRKVTATEILESMGRPSGIKSLREAGGWLRELYGEPERKGGQTKFAIPYRPAHAPSFAPSSDDGDDDAHQDPFPPDMPLDTKARKFVAITHEGFYTPEQVAHLVGHQGAKEEIVTVGKVLSAERLRYGDDGRFNFTRLR